MLENQSDNGNADLRHIQQQLSPNVNTRVFVDFSVGERWMMTWGMLLAH